MIHGNVEPIDIYDVEAFLYDTEAKLNKFCQQPATSSATANVAQAMTSTNLGRYGNSSGSHHYFRGRARSICDRGRRR